MRSPILASRSTSIIFYPRLIESSSQPGKILRPDALNDLLQENVLTDSGGSQHNPVVVDHFDATDLPGRDSGRVAQLTTRVNELEAALAALQLRSDNWLSTVSHDLRGPLTLIIGHADRLRHRSRASRDSAQTNAELEAIIGAARRLDKMVTQV